VATSTQNGNHVNNGNRWNASLFVALLVVYHTCTASIEPNHRYAPPGVVSGERDRIVSGVNKVSRVEGHTHITHNGIVPKVADASTSLPVNGYLQLKLLCILRFAMPHYTATAVCEEPEHLRGHR
jgi:hypothetical protein